MFLLKVNRKLLPLKICFFLLFACFAPVFGFMPTIARQLGYSLSTYGALMTFIRVFTMITTPLLSIIVDKFRVKKILFTVFILGLGVASYSLIFVPKVPLEAIVQLNCYSETVIISVSTKNYLQLSGNESDVTQFYDMDKLITCELNCDEMIFNGEKTDWCDYRKALDLDNKYKNIDVIIKLNDTELVGNLNVFHVLSIKVKGTNVQLSTNCTCPLKMMCRMDCNDKVVMEATTVKTYTGNVLELHQFWMFLILLTAIKNFAAVSSTFLNTICLDILDDKNLNFGKQKLWGSIGWGISSILVGWVMDFYSFGKHDKDYTPAYILCIILTIFNLIIVTTTIKVVETEKSNSKLICIYCLFTKCNVILFIIWYVLCMYFHAISVNFLFWYLEDMVSASDRGQITWLKSVQGIAQSVRCFGGEIPFLFWSGGIIKRMGYPNCMALVLGATAVRMYLYTVISNPAWVVLIELLNGLSYALGFALKMMYMKMIAPPDMLNTFIGCILFFDCVGESLGSLLGGYLFGTNGGVWAFRFFAYSSALACCLNVVVNYFGLIKVDDVNVVKQSTKNNANSLPSANINPTDVDL